MDADAEFRKFGYATVPSQSHGAMSSSQVLMKIDEIAKQTKGESITKTHEGIVLQLVDRAANQVLAAIKVKSIEYELLNAIADLLIDAIEHAEVDTHYDRLT